ncbi:MAG: VC0807 family protein [Rhizomicrobium sp.]
MAVQTMTPPASTFRLVLPTLFVDVLMPVVLFDVLTARGVPAVWALAAGGLPPALNNLRSWITSRRLEPLGVIVMTLLAIGTLTSLISGNVFFGLIKDSFLTGTFGAICLVSLFAAKPLMFSVLRQFFAGGDAARIADWNGRWEQRGFRFAIRLATIVWGVTYIAEALLRVGLALQLPAQQVVTLSPILSFGALIVLVTWTRRYMKAVRDRYEQRAAA